MTRFPFQSLLTMTALLWASHLLAHGIPIDVLANTSTSRLFVLDSFEPADLLLEPGLEISSDEPGIGVNFPANGIADDTPLGLDVTQSLLYWDGNALTSPATAAWIDNPAQSQTYRVSATSEAQTGMPWATYPGGSFWDAHGLFSLEDLSAPTGIYGLAIRITSPDYGASKPFLLPLIYDPQGQWSNSQLESGIDLLRAAVEVTGSADFDGDGRVDGKDFLAWQRGLGPANQTTTHADGDADGDSDVDSYDLAFWAAQFGTTGTNGTLHNVPEPAGRTLLALTLLGVLTLPPRWSFLWIGHLADLRTATR